MLPDRVSNPGPLTYESGALPIALRGPASDLWDCLRRVKLMAKFHRIDLVICSQFRVVKTPSYSQINMVLQCMYLCSGS